MSWETDAWPWAVSRRATDPCSSQVSRIIRTALERNLLVRLQRPLLGRGDGQTGGLSSMYAVFQQRRSCDNQVPSQAFQSGSATISGWLSRRGFPRSNGANQEDAINE